MVGAIVHHDGDVLLLERVPDDFLGGIEELPSGGVEDGETLIGALAREPAEEIGWTGPPAIDSRFVGSFDYTSASGRRARQFTVSVYAEGRAVVLSDEHAAHRWIHPSALAGARVTPETEAVIREWVSSHQ
ncbi:NUDIX domain-containing protein [Planotetraspora kaengkrachanensis]|uniref:8-oxo-dGTP diphosphatase n=1 Tax=Planotetraspora kaengkrachanensis TaxID=575193 RepID=A0A8J3PYZ7_9ACTN|nr:NUDIX domain-containing protein [Planotetraspora kaengkrachanensis]GIG83617.1 hypothetical protein Pka01_67440 [Planotetraspora kaengkrachanensis]